MAKKLVKNLVQLGDNIRLRRIKMGISQEELAFKVGIDRSYLGGIERGERNISILTLVKLAIGLNCKTADLLKDV